MTSHRTRLDDKWIKSLLVELFFFFFFFSVLFCFSFSSVHEQSFPCIFVQETILCKTRLNFFIRSIEYVCNYIAVQTWLLKKNESTVFSFQTPMQIDETFGMENRKSQAFASIELGKSLSFLFARANEWMTTPSPMKSDCSKSRVRSIFSGLLPSLGSLPVAPLATMKLLKRSRALAKIVS